MAKAKGKTNGAARPHDNDHMAPSARKRLTKKQLLISMLRSKSGADVLAISKKLGWQTHTTRAALTGLRKAGYDVNLEKMANGKASRYQITAMPTDPAKTKAQVTAGAG